MASLPIIGAQFLFGLDSDIRPDGIAGFVCRSLELKYEPEVNATATDGYGAVEAVAVSKAVNRLINGTFTGYIVAGTFDGEATATTGSITFDNKTFYVKSVSDPRKKGEFAEVSIEATHYPLAH